MNATNTGFQNTATADKISNDASSGIGSALGIGASMLGKGGAFGAGGALAFLADGGIVPEGGGTFAGSPAVGAVPLGPGGNSPVAPGGQGPGTMIAPAPIQPGVLSTVADAGGNAGNFTGAGGSFTGGQTYFQEGGAVPLSASPSGGAATDDVSARGPSGAIRLDGGEFVLPKSTVSWYGEEKLQKMIAKADQDRAKATAKPRVVPRGALPTQPQIQPRPQQGAIPV